MHVRTLGQERWWKINLYLSAMLSSFVEIELEEGLLEEYLKHSGGVAYIRALPFTPLHQDGMKGVHGTG